VKTIIIMYLLALLAPVASAEVYRWEDENGMNFSDNPASVPEGQREKTPAEATGQIKNPVPHARSEAPRLRRVAVTQEQQIAAYQDNLEQQRRATVATRQNQAKAAAAGLGNVAETFPSLATMVVVCLLLTLFLAIAWVVTIVDIGKSTFITPTIKTVWMVVVILMPGIGMLFYYILGLSQKAVQPSEI